MSNSATPRSAVPASSARALAGFLAKFEPGVARQIRKARATLRALLPTAVEIVYDNYNFFVIGYCATDRASDCIVSLAASAKGVNLSFYYGAGLPDPTGVLQGEGKQHRFVRLEKPGTLRSAPVLALLRAAVRRARTPLPTSGHGRLVIRSISAKQRPRRARATARTDSRSGPQRLDGPAAPDSGS